LDSLQKANDPELQSKLDKEERDRKILEAIERKKLSTLKVEKIANSSVFNTIKREEEGTFIKAIIDENITGYAGSRLRIRLLEDIAVGNKILKKNNYLYAIITGFGDQRVKLQIVTIMYENSILPIKLSIYDVDGMEGLYIPSSQFREFTKELGDASVQGVSTNSVDGGDSQNQFFTSIAQRLFQSTSSAISKIIRMNKAKLKYESHIYLVDDTAMEETRKSIYEQNKNKQ
jgi:conjugative transposon TraM protein